MRLHRIGCVEKERSSPNLRARFKETQTFLTKPFPCPTNERFMMEQYLNSTPLKFCIEGENGAHPDYGVFPDMHTSPQLNVAFDHAKRTDDAVVGYVNGSINTCRRMDHGKFLLPVFFLTRRRFQRKGIYLARNRKN